ncbi:MAG: molybdopterin oxidoreductase family protein [Armatimonadetes bacterium]|jgi:anaerobic selenocysteine-containing dehydrogenase|nr:molybdopterin oxidoreductase family protein [Armatimonadota bacterium]
MTANREVMQIKGACPHNCPDTCGWVVTLDDAGTPVKIEGDADHPYTRGWLCTKVNRYLDFVLHPERLRHPLRRVGEKGEGRFEQISWDEALDEVTSRWKSLIAEHGPESILPYSYSGTLGLVQNAVCNARLWTRMGASGLDRTICSVAGTEALRVTVGGSFGTDPESVVDSRLVLLWGTNPASTHPHFIPWLDEARRRGARVYLIDPHRSLTATRADVHLTPRPGSDAALALAMMHVLLTEGLVDEAWAGEHTVGLEALRSRALEMPPSLASELTGLPVEQIVTLAREYGTTRPALIRTSMGLQRHSNGGNTIRALAALPALVGDYGKSGGGILYSTGGYWAFPGNVVCPQELAAASPNPEPRVINMNRIGAALLDAEPPVHALYVFNSNPAAVAPNSRRVLEGLSRPDLFTVVHELFLTDTAKYADIVLPATSQFEHWDLNKAYGHLYLSLNRPAMAPLGEARSNWEVSQLLAARMGYTDAAFEQSAEEIIQAALAEGGSPVAGVTWEKLLEDGNCRLNYPRPMVPFASGRFRTPSGKVELFSQQLADAGHDPLPHWEPDSESREAKPEQARRFPLQMVSAASHYFLNSSFGNVPALRKRHGDPSLEIHPEDAGPRGIEDGVWVEIRNDRGSFRARAKVAATVGIGSVFCPTVWWSQHATDGRGANWTTSDELADYAGGATFHGNLVEVAPLAQG